MIMHGYNTVEPQSYYPRYISTVLIDANIVQILI